MTDIVTAAIVLKLCSEGVGGSVGVGVGGSVGVGVKW